MEPKELQMIPLDFEQTANGPVCKSKILYDAVQKFCLAEFGEAKPLATYMRSWAIIHFYESADEGKREFEVVGLVATQNMPDFPVFHTKKSVVLEGRKSEVLEARTVQLMVERCHAFLQDIGQMGKQITIFIADSEYPKWKEFLERMNIKPAQRVAMTV